MNTVFMEYLDDFVVVFLDDILVYSKSMEEHRHHVEKVLRVLRENKLYGKLSKCEFGKDSMPFLGHIVSSKGIQVDPKKILAVQKWPTPKNVTDVRSFLGLCSYYRKFVKDFAKVSSPLTELLKKEQEFKWSDQCEKAMTTLKKLLFSTPATGRRVRLVEAWVLAGSLLKFQHGGGDLRVEKSEPSTVSIHAR
jgi:hypothetical protein